MSMIKTPCYIYDVTQIEQQIKLIKESLNDNIEICYAIKANTFILDKIESVVDRLEVCSPGEYEICIKNNIKPDKIIVSGVNKTYESIYRILEYSKGKGIYTIESFKHYDILDRCAKEYGYNLNVIIRLTSGNQFGVSKDDFENIINSIVCNDSITLLGIHYYSGTQKKISKIEKELKQLDEYTEYIKNKYNIDYFELEYGPGMLVSYFEENEVIKDENQLLQLDVILKELKNFNKITLEFGRFIVAKCGYYLTRINDIKRGEKANYIIVDGGIHQINYYGQVMGMKKPFMKYLDKSHKIRNLDTDSGEDWTICGALCTVNDVIVRKKNVDNPCIDDIIIFEKTGAYSASEGMAMFLTRELPSIYLWDNKERLKLVRDTIEVYTLNF